MAGNVQWSYPLRQRDISHEENPLAQGRGGLTNKTAMRVSSLLERKSSRGEFPCLGVGGTFAGKAQLCYPLCQRDIPREDTPLAVGRGN